MGWQAGPPRKRHPREAPGSSWAVPVPGLCVPAPSWSGTRGRSPRDLVPTCPGHQLQVARHPAWQSPGQLSHLQPGTHTATVLRKQITQSSLWVEGQCGVAAAPIPLSPVLCSPHHPQLRKHSEDNWPAAPAASAVNEQTSGQEGLTGRHGPQPNRL